VDTHNRLGHAAAVFRATRHGDATISPSPRSATATVVAMSARWVVPAGAAAAVDPNAVSTLEQST
jgi:hypothetical protein